MKLTELNPRWVRQGGDGGRERIGMSFDCPCGCGTRPAVYFENPPDGGPKFSEPAWHRTGDNFEIMSLSPSLQRADPGGCRWHGWLSNGELVPC